MRMVFGAVLTALGMTAAQPAFATEGAAPVGLASLPVAASGAVTGAVAGSVMETLTRDLSASLTSGLVREMVASEAAVVAPAADALRLPVVRLAMPVQAGAALPIQRRFSGNTMFEYYPAAGSGFHLSGGTRLYSRRNFLKETEDSAHGALAVTRSISAPMATRPGFRRFNPVMTAGYTMALSTAARIGIEGGAMMGHLFANAPGLPHGAFGYHGENAAHVNPVANLVFGLHF